MVKNGTKSRRKMKSKATKRSKINKNRKGGSKGLVISVKSCPLKNKCSPGTKPHPRTCSCLSRKALLKIATVWNQNNDNKIVFKRQSTSPYLWRQINDRMKDRCKDEWCWIQQEYVKRLNSEDINNAYRPEMPKSWKQNKYEWLKTDDIENVMNQYEEAYKDFYFIGPVPIDFDQPYGIGHCVVDELCKLDISSIYEEGIRKIGIVFNLDPHNKPGSHWVCMFCDLKGKSIYYFDSYGINPPKEVELLIERLKTQAKLLNIKLKKKINPIRHQYKNSECGVYCLFFITELLKGHKYSKLIKSPIMDETMNRKRKFFFVES